MGGWIIGQVALTPHQRFLRLQLFFDLLYNINANAKALAPGPVY